MVSFYVIVLSISLIILILLLTLVGVTLSKSTNAQKFPPVTSGCPDYWTMDSSNNCIIPTSEKNKGSHTFTSSNTPGYEGTTINFYDPGWNSSGPMTQPCNYRTWALANNIIWGGVSNSNQCS